MFTWLKKRQTPSPDGPVATPQVTPPPAPEAPLRDDATVESQGLALVQRAEAALQGGDPIRALDLYSRAHRANPQDLHALYWLATLHQEAGDLPQARAYAEAGLAIDAAQIGLMLRFGNIAAAMHDPVAALACYERVAQLDADVPDIDALQADQYCVIGRIADGVAAFDRAIARNSGSVVLQQNRLFVLNYSDILTPEALADEHRHWAKQHEAQFRDHRLPHDGLRDPGKLLHVGLVSGDLRNHAVAHFAEQLLRGHDRDALRLIVFDTSTDAEDTIMARMKPMAHGWHRVAHLNDNELAASIRDAGVDILVDMSGHTKGNRLLVFARKPAPVQMTWLGYLATTGLHSMNYRLTDAYMDPVGTTETLHSEALLRLPVQACFAPWPESPPVGPLPSQSRGYVTYGSVNQWSKVSTGVRDLWARILVQSPTARLKVVAKGGHTEGMRKLIVDEFVHRGVRAAQIEVVPFLDTLAFLELLQGIDIALDPFPYGGGTTTMHCLWMGVPVVTLQGRTALSRNSIGPLMECGLDALVANVADEYIEIATTLGRDTARLTTIRSTLRTRMLQSRLTDSGAFGRAFGEACRRAWQCHCTDTEV